MIVAQEAAPNGTRLDLPSAADVRRIIEQKAAARASDAEHHKQVEEEELKHRHEIFLARKLTPDFITSVMERARRAAENGETKVLLDHFPSDWCLDGGRRINIAAQDWPATLQGIAREFFEFWERELKPRGFKLSAEIINFTRSGALGDVGAYLSWSA
jgi:hypothetical protein